MREKIIIGDWEIRDISTVPEAEFYQFHHKCCDGTYLLGNHVGNMWSSLVFHTKTGGCMICGTKLPDEILFLARLLLSDR